LKRVLTRRWLNGKWPGGCVFDAYASYSWLHIGSFAVGLSAVAVVLTFKPVPAATRLGATA